MTAEPGANGAPDERAQGRDELGLSGREHDAMLAWVGEHLTVVRQSASGQRVFYWILGTAVALGLAAHVGGFVLKDSTSSEFVLLLADLLYALGFALWTSVIVVVFMSGLLPGSSASAARTPHRRPACGGWWTSRR